MEWTTETRPEGDTLLAQKCAPIVEMPLGIAIANQKQMYRRMNHMKTAMENNYSETIQPRFWLVGMLALCTLGTLLAQNKAIGFKTGMPFSDGYVAGNTLYVAGQQGPDSQGRVTGTDITLQTTNAIAAIEKVIKKAGFQMTDITSVTVYITDLNDVPKMNDVYKKLMPDPKPARATVQVAGLIGGAKIEISAIAVKH
jgi:2-iminobutanoate/2-iminopropanoate deaminase